MIAGSKTEVPALSLDREIKMEILDYPLKHAEGEMGPSGVKVLFVDDHKPGMSHLLNHLRKLGCACSLARSYDEACDLSRREKFDLILSRFAPQGESCHELITLLAGTQASFFYFYAVEHGCWWIPRMRFGQECWGETALRPRQFAHILQGLIQQIVGRTLAGKEVSAKSTRLYVQESAPKLALQRSEVRRLQNMIAGRTFFADCLKTN